jgi:hypothetical protein
MGWGRIGHRLAMDSENNPAQFRGLESKKNPVKGEAFFLTSPYIELTRNLLISSFE